MRRNLNSKFFSSVLLAALFALGSVDASAEMQGVKASFKPAAETQQTRFSEYRGVMLGMSANETRTKLGTPSIKDGDQDFFVLSENETAQIVYDAAQKVITISVDYLGGIGAPDYKSVVGAELERTASGSLYRLVRYESFGYWASYHRTQGAVQTVTVTLQKI